ncbi:Aste57867_8724 [Aphanomyces stellatus]|uniref:Aste57867_8724 protein n=1 Tax=Aphanomyces stellatus TaxID=120398 RepID=A0A485KL00_9STRA|nr:hypothetical protein As57867_008690 [Aphanomyces stellatus]VFT85610.1 Aste57867_8724 [Aphanomyces stellatus]
MEPTSLLRKTGKKVLDKNGRVVDEMKEDTIHVRVYDPDNKDVKTNPYRPLKRSNFRLKTLNRLLQCNAHYIRDQFQNVIWPKDWLMEVRPAEVGAPWCYDVIVKDEPELQDDALDPRYEGSTVVKVANVPKQVQEKDLRAWLMAGLVQEYEPIVTAKFDIAVLTKKREMLRHRLDDVPSLELDGKDEEQIETRQKLVKAMTTQTTTLDEKLAKAQKKLAKCTRLLLSEPVELSFLKDGTEHRYVDADVENDKEKYNWFADFKSLRGPELALLAIEKPDWGTLRLATTRPEPMVSSDEFDDPTHEVNMRTVRVSRVKHGRGGGVSPYPNMSHSFTYAVLMQTEDLPTDDEFHFSSIDAMYSGRWVSGMKHDDNARDYTNYGLYHGAYVYNVRDGRGELVYGKGDAYTGFFDVPKAHYRHRSHDPYPRPLLPMLFKDGVPHGRGVIKFADGATYDGEMRDGRITGRGRYVSSTGVIEDGEFVDGMLHGDGSREEPNGHVEEGTFVYGVLDGFGTQRSKYNEVYEGSFDFGSKTGRGVMTFPDNAVLRGFWDDDLPSGRGDLLYYQRRDHDDDEIPFYYEGTFSEGKVKGRHRHVDVDKRTTGHVPFTTYGKSATHMAYPLQLAPALFKQRQRHFKNRHRRQMRESKYQVDIENANLGLYYNLLDEFYEEWAEHVQAAQRGDDAHHDVSEMTPEELQKLREKKKRAHKPIQVLRNFESYLHRVPLAIRDKLALANAALDKTL